MGLKLEHAYTFHSQAKECKHSKTHFHAENSHDDLLDSFFQPLAQQAYFFVEFQACEFEQKVEKKYTYLFYSKIPRGIGLRAPPKFMFT